MQFSRLVFHILGYHLSFGNRDFKSPDTAEVVTYLNLHVTIYRPGKGYFIAPPCKRLRVICELGVWEAGWLMVILLKKFST
jgi:hypothetical protein